MRIETRSRKQNSALIAKYSILYLALCALLSAFCFPVEAQPGKQVYRVGYLSLGRGLAAEDSLRSGLRDLGYVEGKNLQIDCRYGAGLSDRATSLVSELLRLKVNVIVSPVVSGILAAKQATKTIPIVIVTNQDPVAMGLVDSLARPGGNITGLTRLTRELAGKRLELLKEMLPTTLGIGILLDPDSAVARVTRNEYADAARTLKIPVQFLEVKNSNADFAEAFRVAAKERVNAIITLRNPLLIDNRKRIAEFAIQNRMPLMSEGSVFVDAGGLLSYSSDENHSFRRAAYYVDKILKGANPADLPVEQPTKFELVINLKTAKQIGLIIPPNVLARADRVIR
jgi:putative tryptophan/tyrosine transport system substrate-binding protein